MNPLLRATTLVLFLCLLGCPNPVKEAETAFTSGNHLSAFRLARTALQKPDLEPAQRKRLGAVLEKSAHALLESPDPKDITEARELFEAMPAQTGERERAAQRLFRVIVRQSDAAGLEKAFAELEKEMGEESSVRSNLRSLVEETRGKPISVAVAKLVTQKWPDGFDRWVDLARSQAALGAYDDAKGSMLEAEKQLAVLCEGLPGRMASYDKVRRESAYGQLEIKRCHGFHQLAAEYASYARKQAHTPGAGTDILASTFTSFFCPAETPLEEPDWAAGTPVVMVSPVGTTWWIDGKMAKHPVMPVTPGDHDVVVKEDGECRGAKVTIPGGATAVLSGPLGKLPSPTPATTPAPAKPTSSTTPAQK